jgi:hypothetical protein
MKTNQQSKPVLTQTQNNTTLWVGHLQSDPNGRLAGQTFECPTEGVLNNIQIMASAVSQEGDVQLSLHEFDPGSKTWGPAIADSQRSVEKKDQAHWISFELQPVSLRKDRVYGFRLQSENALIGIGEAASHAKQPFSFGQEWSSRSSHDQGNYYQYFSLAFKVEMCA